MTWVYLDDDFPNHPKVEAAGDLAGWLFVCGLAYCKRFGTGGRIPKAAVQKLIQSSAAKPTRALVDAGLWEHDDPDFVVHDYLDWNRTSEAKRAAAQKAANKRWGNAAGDASAMPEQCDSDATDDAEPCPIPPHPPFEKGSSSSIEEAGPQAVEKQGLDKGGIATALRRGTSLAVELVASNGSNGKGRE